MAEKEKTEFNPGDVVTVAGRGEGIVGDPRVRVEFPDGSFLDCEPHTLGKSAGATRRGLRKSRHDDDELSDAEKRARKTATPTEADPVTGPNQIRNVGVVDDDGTPKRSA